MTAQKWGKKLGKWKSKKRGTVWLRLQKKTIYHGFLVADIEQINAKILESVKQAAPSPTTLSTHNAKDCHSSTSGVYGITSFA